MDGCATKNSYARLGLLGLLGFESHPSGQESKVGHTRIVTWFETISNPPLYLKSLTIFIFGKKTILNKKGRKVSTNNYGLKRISARLILRCFSIIGSGLDQRIGKYVPGICIMNLENGCVYTEDLSDSIGHGTIIYSKAGKYAYMFNLQAEEYKKGQRQLY